MVLCVKGTISVVLFTEKYWNAMKFYEKQKRTDPSLPFKGADL
jgi:hypothetical protein